MKNILSCSKNETVIVREKTRTYILWMSSISVSNTLLPKSIMTDFRKVKPSIKKLHMKLVTLPKRPIYVSLQTTIYTQSKSCTSVLKVWSMTKNTSMTVLKKIWYICSLCSKEPIYDWIQTKWIICWKKLFVKT